MIKTKTIKVKICVCDKCGYEWQPRHKIKDVKLCPKCKTVNWNKGK